MTRDTNPPDWIAEIEDADFDDGFVGHCYEPGPEGIVLSEDQSRTMRRLMAEPPKALPFPARILPLREVRP